MRPVGAGPRAGEAPSGTPRQGHGQSRRMLAVGTIVVIVVVAVGVLIAFRIFGHMGKIAARNAARAPERREEARNAPRSAELSSCPKCGVYTGTPCDRPDCPIRA